MHSRGSGRWAVACALLLMPLGGCREQTSEAAAPPAVSARFESLWKVGVEQEFDVVLATRLGPPKGSAMFGCKLDAKLVVAPVASEGERTTLALALRDVRLVPDETNAPADAFATVVRELEEPFGLVLERGVVIEQILPKAPTDLTVGLMRTVADALQLAAPAAPGPWHAEAYDATGRYVARYEPGERPGAYLRVKERYVQPEAPKRLGRGVPATVPAPTIQVARTEYRLGKDGLEHVSDEERLTLPLQLNASIESSSSVELDRVASRKVGLTAPRFDMATSVRIAPDASHGTHGSGTLDAAKIDGLTVEEAIAGLDSLAPKDPDAKTTDDPGGRQAKLMIALGTLLRTQPDKVPLVREQIRQGTHAAVRLTTALGSSGTVAGHRALVDLIRDTHLPEASRSSAALALARVKKPTDVAIKAMLELAEQPAWQRIALYGLGTYARLLVDEGKKAESDRLVAYLTARVGREERPRQRADVLRALSNAGSAAALDTIKPYLEDPRPVLRSAAVTALRLVEAPEADALIAQRVADETLDVRLAAVDATQGRPPASVLADSLAHAALGDKNRTVRYRAVRRLVSWADERPALRETLKQVAVQEKEPAIRQLAERAQAG